MKLTNALGIIFLAGFTLLCEPQNTLAQSNEEDAPKKITYTEAEKKRILFDAIQEGVPNALAFAFSIGATLQMRDDQGRSPLMAAAVYNIRISINYLIRVKKAPIHEQDANGLNALAHAIQNASFDAIEELQTNGAKLDNSILKSFLTNAKLEDKPGTLEGLLFFSIKIGDLITTTALLQKGTPVIITKGKNDVLILPEIALKTEHKNRTSLLIRSRDAKGRPYLVQALKTDNIEVLERAIGVIQMAVPLNLIPDYVELTDTNGKTALDLAIENKNEKAIDLLINQAKARLGFKTVQALVQEKMGPQLLEYLKQTKDDGKHFIVDAAKENDLVALKFLTEQGITFDLKTLEQTKSSTAAMTYLESVKDPKTGLDFFFRTVASNDLDGLKRLLNLRLTPPSPLQLKIALVLAIANSNIKMAEFLLRDASATLTQEALDAALKKKTDEILRLIIGETFDKGYSLLSEVVELEDEALVTLLLNSGVSPDAKISKTIPLVQLAVCKKNNKVFNSILNFKPDLAVMHPQTNASLLTTAAECGTLEVFNTVLAAFLEKKDKNLINHQDNKKVSALMAASIRGEKAMVEALIAADADYILTNSDGLTARQLAKTPEMAAVIAAKQDPIDFPRLEKALAENNKEAFDKLMKEQANINAKNQAGKTLLDLAFEKKDIDRVVYLSQKGAVATPEQLDSLPLGTENCQGAKHLSDKPFWVTITMTDNAGNQSPVRIFCDQKNDGGGWMLASENTDGKWVYDGFQNTLKEYIAKRIDNIEFRVEAIGSSGTSYKQFLKNDHIQGNDFNGNPAYFGRCRHKWDEPWSSEMDWGLNPSLVRNFYNNSNEAKAGGNDWRFRVDVWCHRTMKDSSGSSSEYYEATMPTTHCESTCGGFYISPTALISKSCAPRYGFRHTGTDGAVSLSDWEEKINAKSIRIWIK